MQTLQDLPVEFEERDDYVLYDLSGWNGDEEIIADIEDHWAEIVNQDRITGSISIYSDGLTLGPEFQEYIAEQWSDLAERTGLQKVALVSDGVTKLAISANVDVPGVEIETFDTTEDAVEWIEQ